MSYTPFTRLYQPGYRCRGCGHLDIEHRDPDLACPTCDEDADLYRDENQPAEDNEL